MICCSTGTQRSASWHVNGATRPWSNEEDARTSRARSVLRRPLKESSRSLVVHAPFQGLTYQMIGQLLLLSARKYKCCAHLHTQVALLTFIIHRYLYWLVVCVDACFRFKNRLRSSDQKDPTLGPGWSYMVDHGPYIEHVKKYASEAEVCPSAFCTVEIYSFP